MVSRSLLLLLLFGLYSCIPYGFPELGTDTVERGEYKIHISGAETETTLIGKDIDTQWIPEDRWIYMGTDEKDTINPIGTITIQLGDFSSNIGTTYLHILDSLGNPFTISGDQFDVIAAAVSKTEKAKGTAAELDAKLFELGNGSIHQVEVGSNYIRGWLLLIMDRVLPPHDPNAREEKVIVTGEFTAMSR
ncbi:MAG: hypothetical protein OEQ53_17020 [Saprospiraceae bacterium]|nr:hypothetical protein [Saprospiraceae bacterium]